MPDTELARIAEWLREEVSSRIRDNADLTNQHSNILTGLSKDFDHLVERVASLEKTIEERTKYVEGAQVTEERLGALEGARPRFSDKSVKFIVIGVVATVLGVSVILVLGAEVKDLLLAYLKTMEPA